ncbi:MAG: transporter substrate-binding domain-containing protein [candidate division Zixibacteria bacterium]|nr:transporter substrate-binding domain-containing protein [Candidatus Tariuqbacter arcticus]
MKKTLLVISTFLLLWGCQKNAPQSEAEPTVIEPVAGIDLGEIKERGKLIAITGYNATGYFIYKGQPMGYEYELLESLAKHLGLEIEIRIARNMNDIFKTLNSGEGDLIAHGLTITKERTKRVTFTKYHNLSRQVLVQRKPENWRQLKLHEIDKRLIRNPIDLIGKKVYVRRGSSYYSRLVNLSEEIGGDIEIIEVPGNVSTEELISQVALGEIEFTIADENIALINQAYHSDLDVGTAVSFPQRIAWAVRKTSPELLAAVDDWITVMKDCTDYYVIYNKYFKNRRAFRERIRSDYYSLTGGGISKYDELIRENAGVLKWDWRLLASLIYQESQFDPLTKSWAGAVGLMQLMPKTGAQFGGKNLSDPAENIKAGTAFLKWLDDYWKDIPDSTEQLKFILASYNAGQGHIADARRLTEKFGRYPNVWEDNVAYYILKKANREYFNDEVVKYGYCRGEEPFNYVDEILERYEHYMKLVE